MEKENIISDNLIFNVNNSYYYVLFLYIKKIKIKIKIDEVFFTYSVVVGKTYSHFVHFCSKVDSLATQLFLWTPLKNKNKNP